LSDKLKLIVDKLKFVGQFVEQFVGN